eukprot:585074_1
MEIYYFILLFCATTAKHSSNCVCTNWSCNGHTSSSNSTPFHHCVSTSSLWETPQSCTTCTTCSTYNSSTTCTCDTQSKCTHPLNNSGFWWAAVLCVGGLLFLLFICAILVYIYKSVRQDEDETALANVLQLRQTRSNSGFEEEAQGNESDTYSEPESSTYTGNKYHLQTPLNIVINDLEKIQTIPPYPVLFKGKYWEDIDIYTKYLVVGFVSKHTAQLSFTLDSEYIMDVIHVIIICLYDDHVCFDTYCAGKSFVMSPNAFYCGVHEWTVEVTHTGLRTQEVGIISTLDTSVNLESARLSGEDVSICDISQFGARGVYGGDTNAFYYASYNENNFERCKVNLNKYHKGDHWNEGDRIRICLDLQEKSVKFYLNGKRMRKRIKIQKNRKYYPIMSCYGRFKCRVVDFK